MLMCKGISIANADLTAANKEIMLLSLALKAYSEEADDDYRKGIQRSEIKLLPCGQRFKLSGIGNVWIKGNFDLIKRQYLCHLKDNQEVTRYFRQDRKVYSIIDYRE